MKPDDLLRIVDTIHRDKKIDKELVFEGIEAALVSAAKKHYGEEEEIFVSIDREKGTFTGTHNGAPLDPAEMSERIGAQTAKQVMIQKIREAERDQLYDEYLEQKYHLVSGVVQRYDGGRALVALSNVEAILPKGEQIPGETYHNGERVRATVYEVQKSGSRVKVVLSRIRPALVERLFEQEIPEIADGVIEIRAISREPGYRSKVAVSSSDQRVDCVGACVGVRGNRIKSIVDQISGERIDIVRWNEDMQVLIPNALQPAEVEEVILCQMMGRAIVLVHDDQLSLAIGKRGQNVRLASKLCGWDIEIMTQEELAEQLEQTVIGFCEIDGITEELAERLVGEGYLSYDDLSIIEPDDLMEMGGLSAEDVDRIVDVAERRAEEAERAVAAERRRRREQARLEASGMVPAPEEPAQAAPEVEADVAAEVEADVAADVEADVEEGGVAAEEDAASGDLAPVVDQPNQADEGETSSLTAEALATEEAPPEETEEAPPEETEEAPPEETKEVPSGETEQTPPEA